MQSKKEERGSLSFRVTLGQRQQIVQLAKLAGLNQQDYLLRVALAGLPASIPDTSLAGVVASQQQTIASQQETINQLTAQLAAGRKEGVLAGSNSYPEANTADSASSYQVGVCVRGVEAQEVLARATKYDHPAKYDRLAPLFVLADGLLWLRHKTSHGVTELRAYKSVPGELIDCMDEYDRLSKLYEAITTYEKLTALEDWDLLPYEQRKRFTQSCYWSPGSIAILKDASEAIAKLSDPVEDTPIPVEIDPTPDLVQPSNSAVEVDEEPEISEAMRAYQEVGHLTGQQLSDLEDWYGACLNSEEDEQGYYVITPDGIRWSGKWQRLDGLSVLVYSPVAPAETLVLAGK